MLANTTIQGDSTKKGKGRRAKRPEIQALRAVAILGVLVYHFWPTALPGGFLGVDVFFVISGFLITAHLIRDLDAGTRSPLAFWGRRIRRLMPASLLVILATSIAVLVVVPQQYWRQFLGDSVASLLYVQNWHLASQSVDYLAELNPPSPFQHFWSLSLEEQFYFVWPLVLICFLLIGTRTRHSLSAAQASFAAATAVWAASLGYALYATATNPSTAFFVSTTRAWELGTGALLAAGTVLFKARASQRLAPLVAGRRAFFWGLLGWLLIVVPFLLIDGSSWHPGPATLPALLGTVLIIALGARASTGGVGRVIESRPAQRLGDISYSLYLWHWPVLIVAGYAIGHEPGFLWKPLLIALSVALGYLSYRHVEQPFIQRGELPTARPWRAVAALVLAMVAIASVPVFGSIKLDRDEAAAEEAAFAMVSRNAECFGAKGVFNSDLCSTRKPPEGLSPRSTFARTNVGDFVRDCSGPSTTSSEVLTCDYRGGTGEGLKVAVAGDSHARQYLPLFLEVADDYDWQLTAVTKSACSLSDGAPLAISQVAIDSCLEWREKAVDYLLDQNYDVIVVSQQQPVRGADHYPTDLRDQVDGLVSVWSRLIDGGAHVVSIKDNPQSFAGVQQCISTRWLYDETACDLPIEGAFTFDAQIEASKALSGDSFTFVDFDDMYCWDGTCHVGIRGANVYADRTHLTATWVRTLQPAFEARVPQSVLGDAAVAEAPSASPEPTA